MAVGLTGCAGEVSSVDRAEARVAAKEKALTDAQAELLSASEAFCEASETYVMALDRYGDVLNETAPTVGDVREAGADLSEPRDDAFDGAEEAVAAQQQVVTAEKELAEARAALERANAGTSVEPSVAAPPEPTVTPLAPAAAVDRVMQAESAFAASQSALTDDTPLADASEQFNSAAVALEFAWLRLFGEAGCLPNEQTLQAQAALSAYTTALQQDLATVGYYAGAIDGLYGPETVGAVEALQEANGLIVTGTVDNATADALQAELLALGGAAAQESIATTAAVQQTLKLLGLWDGPVDGLWTPALTDAVTAAQIELGVEPTGAVDAATLHAFQAAMEQVTQPDSLESPTPMPSASDES
ncbi:peptidoglycan-binding domain-containing protein [Micromonospora sp. DT81.3]|uniref:peptidoglycan-binding domain-containing protein n=1 Tax=Micromonospora sp. DT81.3 TaxID=3416523 RepID=UPI003CE6747D